MQHANSRRNHIPIPPLSQSDVERFWSKIDKNGPTIYPRLGACWQWQAGAIAGYGIFKVRENGKVYNVRANRVSYALAKRDPGAKLVCHKCDNPGCCNPHHLFLGTDADNCKDRQNKNRSSAGDKHWSRKHPERVVRGERTNTAKLTAADVIEIRSLVGILPQVEIAARFKITQAHTSSIGLRKCWRHVA
jgi:hypothetical protein